ncbi:hypothetical protein [Methylobacter sp.]|uniref:hypothetical protein n=1 Tax=Methylobacter sp. TaxID=2051955 RepID=UPI0025D38F26|nr:hypothetical protein [Methylobacter sp.]
MDKSELETMLCQHYGYKSMPVNANYAGSAMIDFAKAVADKVEADTLKKAAEQLKSLGWHRQKRHQSASR